MIKEDAIKASNLLMERDNIRRLVQLNTFDNEWIIDIAYCKAINLRLHTQNVRTKTFRVFKEVTRFLEKP